MQLYSCSIKIVIIAIYRNVKLKKANQSLQRSHWFEDLFRLIEKRKKYFNQLRKYFKSFESSLLKIMLKFLKTSISKNKKLSNEEESYFNFAKRWNLKRENILGVFVAKQLSTFLFSVNIFTFDFET